MMHNLYKSEIRQKSMRWIGARLFFGMFAILAGAVILVQVVQFQGISGAGVQEEGSERSDEGAALRVRELSSYRDGAIVHVRFLIESERGGTVTVVHTLEGQGISTRRGEQRLHVEAGVPSLQRLSLAVPELEEEQESALFLTLGISDGSAFAYKRGEVRERRNKEDAGFDRGAFAIPLSLIGVMVLVGGYVAWHLHYHRQMRSFAHHAHQHVVFQHEQGLR